MHVVDIHFRSRRTMLNDDLSVAEEEVLGHLNLIYSFGCLGFLELHRPELVDRVLHGGRTGGDHQFGSRVTQFGVACKGEQRKVEQNKVY